MIPTGEDVCLAPRDHVVHFYATEQDLVSVAGRYLAAGLTDGDRVVVIARLAHREALRTALAGAGCDVGGAEAAGRLLLLDAEATAAQFLVDGSVEPAGFDAVVGTAIRQAAAGRPLRVYGEMVALLWAAGNVAAAVDLERRWNELADAVPFSLFCGYPVGLFTDPAACEAFAELCQLHSTVIAAAPAAPESEASRRFPPARHAPRLARRFVCDTLAVWERHDLMDDAAVVVTELATNVVVHAGSDMVVGLSRIDDGVRLVVTDGSSGLPTRRAIDTTELGGRGLQMVSVLARRWGHDALEAGKLVWAELGPMNMNGRKGGGR